MKKTLLFFAILAIASVATAQIKITTGGNVGIGTNSPSAAQKLHVAGNSYFNGNVGIGIDNPAQKLHVVGNTILEGNIKLSGKVGIETSTPYTALQIGDIWTFHNGSLDKNIGRNTYYNYASQSYVRIENGVASRMCFGGDGNILWQTAPTGTSGSAINTWNSVVMLNNGNFGIGIPNPSQKLHVVGNSYLNGNVGIGVSNPTQRLHVVGETILNGKVTFDAWTDVYIDWTASSSATPVIYPENPGYLHLGKSDRHIGKIYVYESSSIEYVKTSDERAKEHITPLENPIEKIKQLSGYRYNYKREIFPENLPEEDITNLTKHQIGFLAQEVEKVFPELVTHPAKEEEFYGMKYDGMIPVLLEAIKEQQYIIENLQKEIQQVITPKQGTEPQQTIIEELQQRVEYLEEALIKCCNNLDEGNMMPKINLTNPANEHVANPNTVTSNVSRVTEEMKLYQNAPNPFNEFTTIQCYIPQTYQKVELCVYNMQGVQLKCLTVSDRGTVNVQIQAGQLAAGVYTYLLIGDGKTSDAKQMILTK